MDLKTNKETINEQNFIQNKCENVNKICKFRD